MNLSVSSTSLNCRNIYILTILINNLRGPLTSHDIIDLRLDCIQPILVLVSLKINIMDLSCDSCSTIICCKRLGSWQWTWWLHGRILVLNIWLISLLSSVLILFLFFFALIFQFFLLIFFINTIEEFIWVFRISSMMMYIFSLIIFNFRLSTSFLNFYLIKLIQSFKLSLILYQFNEIFIADGTSDLIIFILVYKKYLKIFLACVAKVLSRTLHWYNLLL